MVTSDPKPALATLLRSPRVLAATVVLAGGVAASQGTVSAGVLRAVMAALLLPCALVDIERRLIPNRITGPGALAALAIGLALDPGGEPGRLLWAAIAGGFLLISALAYPAGMGMGDVKLVGMMGLFLGAPVAVALMIALLGNVCAAIVLSARHGVRSALKTGLPFGPYLALGGVVAALWGDRIIHAYLSLHH
jgi:leader peptidase (prepilin peptidase) / N-methyltransferase